MRALRSWPRILITVRFEQFSKFFNFQIPKHFMEHARKWHATNRRACQLAKAKCQAVRPFVSTVPAAVISSPLTNHSSMVPSSVPRCRTCSSWSNRPSDPPDECSRRRARLFALMKPIVLLLPKNSYRCYLSWNRLLKWFLVFLKIILQNVVKWRGLMDLLVLWAERKWVLLRGRRGLHPGQIQSNRAQWAGAPLQTGFVFLIY